MAAIDKLYVHTYYEYDDLRKWAIAYYPELLFYFLDITMTYQQWEDNCKTYVKKQMDIARKEYDELKKLGVLSNRNDIIGKKYQYYRNMGVGVCMESIIESADYTLKMYNMTEEEWEEAYSAPVISTPFEVDKKLLWICPIPCVREYLRTHCGYKTRWYHKLFFKGRKHF